MSPPTQDSMGPETSLPRLSNVEGIVRILRPTIAGEALDADFAPFVHHADLYSSTPEELAARHRPGRRSNWYYFLSHARYRDGRKQLRRHGNGGLWKPSTRWEVVRDNVLVGHRRYYSYMVNGEKKNWVMFEYGVPQDQHEDDGERWVLCKMHKYGSTRGSRARTV